MKPRLPRLSTGPMLALALGLASLLAPAFTSTAAATQNPFLTNRGERTVRSITFFGNNVTREYVLRRELPFQEGDVFKSELVPEARERLDSLPFIAYVDIQPKMGDPGQMDIVIQVEEETRFRWGVGLEYERRHDAWLGEWNAGLLNLTGRGETLQGQLTVAEKLAADLRFHNPHVLGPARLGVFARVGWERFEWRYDDFDYQSWGGALGLTRDFDRWLRLQVEGSWREIEASDFGIDPLALALGPHDFVEQDPGLELSLIHDSRDLRFYPRRGVYARGDLRFGGLGRDYDYTLVQGRVSAFWQFPWVEILAGHVGLRTASNALPFWERVYLGGPMDLRGVDFGSVRGDEAWRATVEWRRPLVLVPLRQGRAAGVGLHAFHDWGQAWDESASASDGRASWSRGLGVHINFNTHNYRFEWANTSDDDNVFVFEDRFTF